VLFYAFGQALASAFFKKNLGHAKFAKRAKKTEAENQRNIPSPASRGLVWLKLTMNGWPLAKNVRLRAPGKSSLFGRIDGKSTELKEAFCFPFF